MYCIVNSSAALKVRLHDLPMIVHFNFRNLHRVSNFAFRNKLIISMLEIPTNRKYSRLFTKNAGHILPLISRERNKSQLPSTFQTSNFSPTMEHLPWALTGKSKLQNNGNLPFFVKEDLELRTSDKKNVHCFRFYIRTLVTLRALTIIGLGNNIAVGQVHMPYIYLKLIGEANEAEEDGRNAKKASCDWINFRKIPYKSKFISYVFNIDISLTQKLLFSYGKVSKSPSSIICRGFMRKKVLDDVHLCVLKSTPRDLQQEYLQPDPIKPV